MVGCAWMVGCCWVPAGHAGMAERSAGWSRCWGVWFDTVLRRTPNRLTTNGQAWVVGWAEDGGQRPALIRQGQGRLYRRRPGTPGCRRGVAGRWGMRGGSQAARSLGHIYTNGVGLGGWVSWS